MTDLKRIILHWTAGGYTPNTSDTRAYHFIIDGEGRVVEGNNPPEANARITNPGDGSTYAPHTGSANTGSIGVALAGMRGATEHPFQTGPDPIRTVQVQAMVKLVARLCKQYGIPVRREAVLSHAEVEETLGIKQRPRWDIKWLPGYDRPRPAVSMGDDIRAMVVRELQEDTPSDTPSANEGRKPQGWMAALVNAILSIFGKGKS